MIRTPTAFCFTLKTIIPRLIVTSFSQVKSGSTTNSLNASRSLCSEDSKSFLKNLTKSIGYGITQTKNTGQILNESPVENYLKKIHKTAEVIHCFDPKTRR